MRYATPGKGYIRLIVQKKSRRSKIAGSAARRGPLAQADGTETR
jgi:hypothetical protein